MSNQKTLKGLGSITFLQESEVGQQPLELQNGQTNDLFAQHHCHASHLARQEKTKEKKMNGTCCHTSCDSSVSATLTPSWASRLRQQLGTGGSMIYKQTWKQKATPQGLLYWAHTASTPRTKGSGSTGWPTATTRDYKDTGDLSKSMIRKDGRSRCDSLARVAYGLVAPWATPNTLDHIALRSDAALLKQATTTRKGRTFPANLREQVDPRSQEIYASGKIPHLSTAETESTARSQLNPRFSLWLMGYPIEWAYCAERVTRSSRKSLQK